MAASTGGAAKAWGRSPDFGRSRCEKRAGLKHHRHTARSRHEAKWRLRDAEYLEQKAARSARRKKKEAPNAQISLV
jgi:hypothetical protein